MQRKVSRRALALSLIAGAALTAAAMAADTTSNTNGVTFVNDSNHHVYVYTRYGDGSCEGKPRSQTASLEAGQSVSIDSGGSSVCLCLQVPERRTCASGWSEVKAGGTRHLK
ncbi:MAG TPA: hypothetical protein VGH73_07690 [Thermoanaerobaculia bacterium]|jgi:hypothetical protein